MMLTFQIPAGGGGKTFRHMLLRSSVSSNVNMMIRGFATAAGNLESEKVVENRRGDFVTSNNTLMMNDDMSKAEKPSPNETTSLLIDSLCKQDRFDDVRRVLIEMFDNGFSPSMVPTLNNIFRGFLQNGDFRKAFEMRFKIYPGWLEEGTKSLLFQGLSDEVTYTSLMNAYLDEGKWDYARNLFYKVEFFGSLPESVLYSVFINGLNDNKPRTRTTEINKHLLRFNYEFCLSMPMLRYHSTMVENSSSSDDEFKILVEIVEDICIKGLENVFDMMLKLNYKPDGIDDGIVYNLFIFAHCKHDNVAEAYIMYKEMVHYGFACHMFAVLALIKTLEMEDMVNELLWVIQNVLRSCNLNDSEIVKFLNEVNPEEPDSEALFDVLAEKAKDGLFLKCSYAPPSA